MSDDTLKKYFEKHPKRDQPHGADRLQRILDKVKASEPRATGGGLAAIIAALDKKKPKGGGGHNGGGMSGPSPSISQDMELEDSKEEVKPEESECVEIEISPETEPVIVHVKRKRRYPKISM